MYEFFDCNGVQLLRIDTLFNERVFVEDHLKNGALNALFHVATSTHPLKRDVLARVDWVEIFGTVVDIQDMLDDLECGSITNLGDVYPAFK